MSQKKPFRRGEKAWFVYSGTLQEKLVRHSGQQATVLRKLASQECDLENWPMYRIVFDDGVEGDAFVTELSRRRRPGPRAPSRRG